VQAFFIPSGSMEETLHGCTGCTGDRVPSTRCRLVGEPEPGDIVVFKGPDTWTPEVTVTEPGNPLSTALLWLGRTVGVAPPSEDDLRQAVIAVRRADRAVLRRRGPGDRRRRGADEPYIHENTPIESRAFGPVTVEEGPAVVMGRPTDRPRPTPRCTWASSTRATIVSTSHRQGGDDRLWPHDVSACSTHRTSTAVAAAATVAP
jgi:signal peptidase I